jgi:hypothetical protein
LRAPCSAASCRRREEVHDDGQWKDPVNQKCEDRAQDRALRRNGFGSGHQDDDEKPGDGDDVHVTWWYLIS